MYIFRTLNHPIIFMFPPAVERYRRHSVCGLSARVRESVITYWKFVNKISYKSFVWISSNLPLRCS